MNGNFLDAAITIYHDIYALGRRGYSLTVERIAGDFLHIAGGGSGKSMDLDEFDFGENCYKQLIVWNPEADEIIGGYRYLLGKDWKLDENGQPILATSHMFHFSEKFLKEYMPYTVELGRSYR